MDGFDLIRGVMHLPEPPHVVMITAFASIETAIRAVKLGAYDYIAKPFEIEELLLVADKALGERALRTKVERLQREVEDRFGFDTIIAKSQAMRDVLQFISRAAPTDSTILLSGESGTGKELAARAIHALSPRRRAPFVAINCAALPETLIESELFGHEKGAFTGALERRAGCFELAQTVIQAREPAPQGRLAGGRQLGLLEPPFLQGRERVLAEHVALQLTERGVAAGAKKSRIARPRQRVVPAAKEGGGIHAENLATLGDVAHVVV